VFVIVVNHVVFIFLFSGIIELLIQFYFIKDKKSDQTALTICVIKLHC